MLLHALPASLARQVPEFASLYRELELRHFANPGVLANLESELESIKRRLLTSQVSADEMQKIEAWCCNMMRQIKAACFHADCARAKELRDCNRLN